MVKETDISLTIASHKVKLPDWRFPSLENDFLGVFLKGGYLGSKRVRMEPREASTELAS